MAICQHLKRSVPSISTDRLDGPMAQMILVLRWRAGVGFRIWSSAMPTWKRYEQSHCIRQQVDLISPAAAAGSSLYASFAASSAFSQGTRLEFQHCTAVERSKSCTHAPGRRALSRWSHRVLAPCRTPATRTDGVARSPCARAERPRVCGAWPWRTRHPRGRAASCSWAADPATWRRGMLLGGTPA